MEVVVAADATELAATWLRTQLAAEGGYVSPHVGATIPTTRPDTFVVVSRTGGPLRSRIIDDAQLAVDSWATTPQAAHDLAQWCRGLMFAAAGQMLGGHQVYRVDELGGPALLPDPLSDQPRYRALYQMSVRCTVNA